MLTRHLRRRNGEGVRMNVNFLGEAILGEAEARAAVPAIPRRAAMAGDRGRLDQDLDALFADLPAGPRAHRGHVVRPARAPVPHGRRGLRFTRPDGKVVPKFVYLDMEEYRDKEPDGRGVHAHAGPARDWSRSAPASPCRAYIPDSFRTLLRLQAVGAATRARPAAARITIRLVKGANMESERARGLAARLAAGALQDQAARPTPITSAWSTK